MTVFWTTMYAFRSLYWTHSTHACGDSIFPLCSLTFYSALYEVWTICHRTRNVATMSASMFHWALFGGALTKPLKWLSFAHLAVYWRHIDLESSDWFAVTDSARFNFIFFIKFKEILQQQKPNAKILCTWHTFNKETIIHSRRAESVLNNIETLHTLLSFF